VTGAAGTIGAIGRNLTAMLLAKGHKVRALVRPRTSAPTPCAGSPLRSCRATWAICAGERFSARRGSAAPALCESRAPSVLRP
jgi:nucleoside-diphosphate-sugar epimerase